ncbi:hypothetical protein BU26DRAFT_518526 [Trematosphaeria pertusa]|uniref:Uncharacterized protein n=1 Tax=Trematosphaeria pertusa TaxID=390896 RepID=A0A6A6IKI3_9PLEO|nr:uncharacterized protein BU26DRAFT_518526 [Trematosphaeria pertusa]KAF2250070.1 hypothetical protein BU26DRAFT_518526 [Trematosphaeria pertusa]
MPPKKEKLSKEQVRDLLRNYGIRFEGPVPPRDWPSEHERHFHAIRDISYIRYDDYKHNRNVERERRRLYKQRANKLRQKASDLLEDLSINEATWRAALEQVVSEPFEQDVVCRRCGDETWFADFLASPLDQGTRATLRARQTLRKKCTCESGPPLARTRNNVEEDGPVFCFAVEAVVTHCAEDDALQHLSVPMKPDRVIGLRPTSRINHCIAAAPRHLSHCPIRGRNIVYPFLVIEAKKEEDAPGFRAIQKQTAFPVRRLLQAQNDLRSVCGVDCEPFLVWFFAYQGEEWRLYAGTLESPKVRIYDLWHGTIESQDGALQLLLIVDYIWSWARDIYRPAIMSCLLGPNMEHREHSPATTDRFRYSLSVPTEPRSPPIAHDLDLLSMDQALLHVEGTDHFFQVMDQRTSDPEVQPISEVMDTHSHPFLRWTAEHELSPSWTSVANIRHSDIVSFNFQLYTAPIPSEDARIPSEFAFPVPDSCTFTIPRELLLGLASFWTNTTHSSLPISSGMVHCTILFHTYCEQTTWQIQRVLNCIVWECSHARAFSSLVPNASPAGITAYGSRPFNAIHLQRRVQEVQQMRGGFSVFHALRNTSFILKSTEDGGPTSDASPDIRWIPCEEIPISPNQARFWMDGPDYDHLDSISTTPPFMYRKLLEVHPSTDETSFPLLQDLQENFGANDAILAVKPQAWPSTCPRFCLFILIQQDLEQRHALHKLLHQTLKDRNLYFGDECTFTEEDKESLRDWCKALKEVG